MQAKLSSFLSDILFFTIIFESVLMKLLSSKDESSE